MELPNKIQSQIDYIIENPNVLLFSETGTKWELFEDTLWRASEKYKDIIIWRKEETILNENSLDVLLTTIDKYPNNNINISISTTQSLPKMFDPIVNLLFWRGTNHANNVSDRLNKKIILFKEGGFSYEFNKKIKGILSSRKNTSSRNYIFNNLIDRDFDGILRYVKYDENKTYDKLNEYPDLIQLIDEFSNSYVSFIIESEVGYLNIITEKTFFSFLTKTLPIFHGHSYFLQGLRNMGFYIFNEDFGYDMIVDSLPCQSQYKMNEFIKTVNNFNKMNISDVQELYEKNIDKIEHNYKLASKLLLGDFKYNDLFKEINE